MVEGGPRECGSGSSEIERHSRSGGRGASGLTRCITSPADYSVDTLLGLMQEVYFHNALAALEGSRLEEQGKMAEAWVWYRAMLRSSRMVGRHAGLVERRYGARMHELAAKTDRAVGERPACRCGDAAPCARGCASRRSIDDARLGRPEARIPPGAPGAEGIERSFRREVPLPGGSGGVLDQFVPWIGQAGGPAVPVSGDERHGEKPEGGSVPVRELVGAG